MFTKHRLLILFLLLLLLHYTSPKKVNASVLFFDDFSNQTISENNWEKKDTFSLPENSHYPVWSVVDGYFKAITQGVSNQNNQYVLKTWNHNETNYIITYDFTKITGADVNVLFNYNINDCFYEVHFSGSNVDISKCGYSWSNGQAVYVTTYPLTNGSTYNVKIELLNSNIKILIKNSSELIYGVLFDINDSGTMWSGKAGLRAGTGLNSNLEIWFDNFKVESLGWEPTTTPTPTEVPVSTPTQTPTQTPTPTPTLTPTPTPTLTPTSTLTPTPTPTPTLTTRPLILVPGLGGSISAKGMLLNIDDPDSWSLTPGSKVYDNLISYYENDPNFYVFYYDWRKPISDSAGDLYQYVKTKVNPTNKVDIIGHSLGGLVARSCIQEQADGCLVNQLVTVGSPHYGAIDSYPLLEGGEIWRDGASRLALEILLTYNQRIGETRKDTITRVAPVLTDLLPTFNYLKINNTVVPYGSLTIANPYLPILNSDYSAIINKTTTVYGENIDTISELILKQRTKLDKLLGLWPDGRVLNKAHTNQGDQTVLVSSATVNQAGIDKIGFSLNHGQLISNNQSLSSILQKLGRVVPEGLFSSSSEINNYLVFMVHSPVLLSLTNPPVGSFLDDHLIIVPEPTSGEYTINLSGIADGQFQLDVGQIVKGKVNWWKYEDVAKKDGNLSWKFKFSPTDNPTNPLVDRFYQLNKKQTLSQVEEFIKLVNQSGLSKNEKKLLLRHLEGLKKKELVTISMGRINLLGLEITILYNQNRINQETYLTWYNVVQKLYDLTLARVNDDSRPIFNHLADITYSLATREYRRLENSSKITSTGSKVLLYAINRFGEIEGTSNPKYRFYQAQIVLNTLKHGEMVRR